MRRSLTATHKRSSLKKGIQVLSGSVETSKPQMDQGARPHHAMLGLSVSIPQGKVVGLAGATTQGKATLLRMLGSDLIPMGGDLLVPPHLRVLHLSVNPTFFNKSLLYNLRYGVDGKDHPDGHIDRVKAILSLLKVSPKLFKYLDENEPCSKAEISWDTVLTQTQKAQLNLARAFISNPSVIVMHNPTAIFSDEMAANVLEVIRMYVSEKGICVENPPKALRHPRTCIMSFKQAMCIKSLDTLYKISKDDVVEVDKETVTKETLQQWELQS